MHQKLEEIVEEVTVDGGDDVDPAVRLQQILVEDQLVNAFTEEDLIEAAKRCGVSDDDISEFFAELAAWDF